MLRSGRWFLLTAGLLACLAAVACGKSAPLDTDALLSIRLLPADASLYLDQTVQLTVEGHYLDGAVIDLTDDPELQFRLNEAGVVQLLEGGRLWAKQAGRARVLAAYRGKEDAIDVEVRYGLLEALRIEPAAADLDSGASLQLAVLGTLSDGSELDLSLSAMGTSYESDIPAVAAVTADGLVFAMRTGTAQVLASHAGFTAATTLRVDGGTPDITALELLPENASLTVGQSLGMQLIATYADGSSANLTDDQEVAYGTSDESVARVDSFGRVSAQTPGVCRIMAVYRAWLAESTVVVAEEGDLIGIQIVPEEATLPIGAGLDLTVFAVYSDDSRVDITPLADYVTSDPNLALVDTAGRVQASAAGQARITARFGGFFAVCLVTVSDRQLTDMWFVEQEIELPLGDSFQLTVMGRFDDGSEEDISDAAQGTSYTASQPAVVSVDADGLVQASGAGTATVTARNSGLSAAAQVSVLGVELVDLRVEPQDLGLLLGQSQQLTVMAVYSDGAERDKTAESTFRSTDVSVATVTTAGRVRAEGAGQAWIWADFGGLEASTRVEVVAPVVVDLWVEPETLTLDLDEQFALDVWALYSDGATLRVNAQASFQTSNPLVATVSAVGLVAARGLGQTVITASLGGLSDTCAVTVRHSDLIDFWLAPDQLTLPPGGQAQLVAWARYADGSLVDETAQTSFLSDAPAVAQVTAGQVTAGAEGLATVTGSFSGRLASCAVRVEDQTDLIGIDLQPDSADLVVGQVLYMTVTASYSDGSQADVTALAGFSSSAPAVAAVAGGGRVDALTGGPATISASFGGLSDASDIVVDEPVSLIGISLAPASATLVEGAILNLIVTAHYSDGSSQQVTQAAAFTPDDPAVVQVSGTGQLTALAAGQTRVVATYGGFLAEMGVTVLPATLERIELTPSAVVLAADGQQQFTVTGFYTNGSQRDLTAQADGTVYALSPTGVVIISPDGLASALTQGGQTTLTAQNGGFADTAQITVADNPAPQLSSLTPQQFVAGAPGPLTVRGAGFIASSVVRVDGAGQSTSFVDAGTLTATLDAGLTGAAGVRQVTVFNPAPGGGLSNSLPLWVVGPPSVATASPSSGLQGRSVRVAFYGQGLLGCSVSVANPGISASDISYSADGLSLFVTLHIAASAALGATSISLSNLAGSDSHPFLVLEDSGFPDCQVAAGDTVTWSGTRSCNDVLIATGATVYGSGTEPLQILATGTVTVRGRIIVSGQAGLDGLSNPAGGGDSGPGGGGGGGGGDGQLDGFPRAPGGAGSPAGLSGGPENGLGTYGGDGGGQGAGSGAGGSCGPGGGGGAFGGDGGSGGSEDGVGAGGAGGLANSVGSQFNGGSGGGGGSTCGSNSGGGGGGGGGVLVIASTGGTITIEGALLADGGTGGYGIAHTGGGGGGSGGRITITSAGGPIVIEDTLSALGGTGGRADIGHGGGGGGGGRIIVDAAGGGVDDLLGYYEIAGGAGGMTRLGGNPGLDGSAGVIDIQH